MRSYLDGMLRYFEFSGRSSRAQYWLFFLVQLPLFCVAIAIDYRLGGFAHLRHPKLPFTLFVSFVHAVPALALSVRRLHDIGKSGGWYLINFLPFGSLVLLVWACRASEPGRNVYDEPETTSYLSRYAPQASLPRYSTIPRQVRMGSRNALPYEGLTSPERFI